MFYKCTPVGVIPDVILLKNVTSSIKCGILYPSAE